MMLIPSAIFAQNTWDVQFKVQLPELCNRTAGIVVVDTNIYVGSMAEPFIYKLNLKSEFVDTIRVKDAQKSMKNDSYINSLAWDGSNMYFTNGDPRIYKLNKEMNQIIGNILYYFS